MELHERIRLAREKAGYETAAAAADALKIPYGTYSGHENSGRGVPLERLLLYAKKYKVSVEWLLTGEGDTTVFAVPIVGLAGADPDGMIDFSTGQGQLGEAPMVPGANGRTVAVEVRGDSMHGVAENGSLVYYHDRRDPPTDDMVGQVCVVGLADGRVMIKRLLRGRRRNHFDLFSFNGRTLPDQKVMWAATILNVVWPGARASGPS